ncbi:hypothetical protein LZ32DRAFT_333866 [Colletotrichum eremochloae]|nr:hypothetical protein LZ32DRAFT_333866 [Colletotrichum eremochloae]
MRLPRSDVHFEVRGVPCLSETQPLPPAQTEPTIQLTFARTGTLLANAAASTSLPEFILLCMACALPAWTACEPVSEPTSPRVANDPHSHALILFEPQTTTKLHTPLVVALLLYNHRPCYGVDACGTTVCSAYRQGQKEVFFSKPEKNKLK